MKCVGHRLFLLLSYLVGKTSFSGMSRAPRGLENWWSFCSFCFWNLWPTQFSLTLSTLQISEILYDWLIGHQQPTEILYHGPGLYFSFLLKFLLTHSPRAFKPSLISFRALWFHQNNLCAMFWSYSVEKQQRQWPHDVILKTLGSSLLPKHLPLQGHSGHAGTLELKTSSPFEILSIARRK